MPPPKGGKKKRKGKDTLPENSNRVLELKHDLEDYAKVTKILGDRRVTICLTDNKSCMGIIPGKFFKKVWICVGDVVLVSMRDFQDNKCDILHKYTDNEIKKLYKLREIPDFFVDKNEKEVKEDNDIMVIMEDEEELRDDDNEIIHLSSNEEESDLDIDNI